MRPKIMITTIAAAIAIGIAPIAAQSVSDIKDAVSKVDEAPVPIRTVTPRYPRELQEAHIQGLVSVQLVVDETGNVIASNVVKASRDEFRQPSLEAVQAWKFKPATVAGKPVKVRLTIPLKFTSEE